MVAMLAVPGVLAIGPARSSCAGRCGSTSAASRSGDAAGVRRAPHRPRWQPRAPPRAHPRRRRHGRGGQAERDRPDPRRRPVERPVQGQAHRGRRRHAARHALPAAVAAWRARIAAGESYTVPATGISSRPTSSGSVRRPRRSSSRFACWRCAATACFAPETTSRCRATRRSRAICSSARCSRATASRSRDALFVHDDHARRADAAEPGIPAERVARDVAQHDARARRKRRRIRDPFADDVLFVAGRADPQRSRARFPAPARP